MIVMMILEVELHQKFSRNEAQEIRQLYEFYIFLFKETVFTELM